ncbi:MAG: transposase mutator type [Myxococcaceae bacterium]|nr:transposase mutator type [Myxococcaceae bacterium]MEA2751873.1 putative transposase [Myxococcales bacterium]
MTEHLGYEAHAADGRGSGNSGDGKGEKTLTRELGDVSIEVARDRNASFETKLVKRQRRFTGLDDRVLAMSRAA